MPPKKQVLTVLKDENHFMQLIDPDNKKLVVLDVHPGWSGPCEMMWPTYLSLPTLIDDFDKRVDIIMCDLNKIIIYKNDKFNTSQTSKPRFVLVQEGKFIDQIDGADIPQLTEKILKNLPMIY